MKYILSILILVVSVQSFAQPYGNEWINYDQTYYEFKIVDKGIYRIDFTTLSNAGINLSQIDPRNIQIFAKEQEIPLYISGESDGNFDNEDYIEFYAEGNDGWIEAELYGGPAEQNNPYYSLYNDTLLYFLTWNTSTDNRRFILSNDNDFEAHEESDYILKYTRTEYNDLYYEGFLDFANTSLSEYSSGEGWSGPRFGLGTNLSFNVNLSTPNVFNGNNAPLARVRSSSASHSNSGGSFVDNHSLRILYGSTEVAHLIFNGYRMNNVDFSMPVNALDNTTTITHEVLPLSSYAQNGVVTDYHSVNYVEIEYPHELDISNSAYFEFALEHDFTNTGKSTLELENFNGTDAVLYINSTAAYRINPLIEDDNIKAVITHQLDQSNSNCVLADVSQIQTISTLEPVSNSGLFTDFAEVEMDSAFIIISHSSLLSSAQNYAGYRQSQGRDVLLVDADDLYKQYGGGVEKCPIAFRRFADRLLDSWSNRPAHLFLLGKSIRQAREVSFGARKDETQFHLNLVPSLGYPCSDNYITGGLNASILEPAISTGRLAATNDQQVLEYLDKVISFEQQESAIWKKNILHFGGGNNLVEQFQFRNYLESFAATAADTCWGAQSFGFYKDSSLPISVNTNDSIADLIANGVSIMTFFGHAYAGGFDQDIENPENLEWNDKFPLVIGNSCFTGDIHQPGAPSTSERFVLLADKGSIGFLSSVKLGYSFNLQQYTGELYKQMSALHYNKGIGEQIQETIKAIQGDGEDFLIKNVTQSMTLQGDPSLVINTVPKPDLQVSADQIFFDPQIVTLQSDSFDVKVVVNNIGKTTKQSFIVELNRILPGNGQTESYSAEVSGLFYSDTITFTLPVDQANGIGINNFNCFVDLPGDNIDEMDNLINNTVIGKSINITSGGIIPIYPFEYAVYPENNVTLKASTGDVFASNKFYRFELDTIDSYNSPMLQSITLNHGGGVVNWDLPITLEDSTVYFWRVGELVSGNIESWQESSFQYIPNEEGWAQAHFRQFKDNQFNLVDYNEPDNQFDFFDGSKNLTCNVLGNSISLSTGYSIDGEVQEYALCQTPPGLAVAVIDPQTLEPLETGIHDFGNFNTYDYQTNTGFCRNRPEAYFLFRQFDSNQMAGLRDMLEDSIPDGHYILIYSLRYMSKHDWNIHAPFIFSTFNDLGMNGVTAAPDSLPFAFFTRKGFPGSAVEEIGTEIGSIIDLSADLNIDGEFGSIRAVNAGLSPDWQSLHWIAQPQESGSADSLGLELYGVRQNGSEQLLQSYSGLAGEELDIGTLFDDQYVRAYLKATVQDENTATPAQLRRWHLLYDAVPEAAINPSIAFEFVGEELEEGENLSFITAIENISNKDMDSLLVRYWIQDQFGQNHVIPYERQAPLLAGQSLIDTIVVNTFGYPGINTFWIEVNPIDPTTGQFDQLEQYHFNNIAQIQFKVNEDNINPVLDVTFDGLHILDGEIVSPRPEIHIRLNDENPYLLMNEESDTAFFSVFLTPEFSGELIPVNFRNGLGEEVMQFIPANSSDNVSSIYYQPEGLEDGVYTLIVIASDKSGNESGDINYRINFEVINESSITEILNYPNPFSTRTHFVFTLTGSEIPDYFKIEIMTINGTVVKEIFKEDLGDLRIGRNVTDYYWDGRDNFGDQLANGIYLYRVITRNNGSDVKKRENTASQYFNNGFGKMYLMR